MALAKKVFLSYSHANEEHKDRLDKFFSQMKNTKQITTWSDRKLLPGDNFDEKISSEIASADIIILLISADFLSSSYCYNKELKAAIKRHKNKEALAIGIILSPCDWKDTPLKQFQLLPKDAKPLTGYPENQHDAIYLEIVQNIKKAIKEFKQEKPVINATRKSGIKMILPINKPVWINSDYFITMSEFTKSICTFLLRAERIIAETSKEYLAYKNEYTKISDVLLWDMLNLQTFFQQLCREINIALFKYGGVRTHVRYLHICKKEYLKLAAAHDSKNYNDEMQPIPWINSMIYQSEIQKKSLIRSLNPEFHYGKKLEDSKYQDYITFTLVDDSLSFNGHCLLSMGISFEDPRQYKNLMYHLNYCDFESIIMDIIKRFSSVTKLNVVNTILSNQEN